MRPFDLILSKLNGVKRCKSLSGERRAVACCPAHDDRHPSINVRELSDGRVLIVCRADCGSQEIVQAIGLNLFDLFPPSLRIPPVGRKGASQLAHDQPHPITRMELAEAAFHVFACAKIVQGGGALAEYAQLELASIVGRMDVDCKAMKNVNDRQGDQKLEAHHEQCNRS